ncbi:hypothetical protein C8T65DRAFT_157902 [Cerioporus squamosus]|nr:hypothetical protein C8T65DRAFT_157902 [Cerioporus squamosus]
MRTSSCPFRVRARVRGFGPVPTHPGPALQCHCNSSPAAVERPDIQAFRPQTPRTDGGSQVSCGARPGLEMRAVQRAPFPPVRASSSIRGRIYARSPVRLRGRLCFRLRLRLRVLPPASPSLHNIPLALVASKIIPYLDVLRLLRTHPYPPVTSHSTTSLALPSPPLPFFLSPLRSSRTGNPARSNSSSSVARRPTLVCAPFVVCVYIILLAFQLPYCVLVSRVREGRRAYGGQWIVEDNTADGTRMARPHEV